MRTLAVKICTAKHGRAARCLLYRCTPTCSVSYRNFSKARCATAPPTQRDPRHDPQAAHWGLHKEASCQCSGTCATAAAPGICHGCDPLLECPVNRATRSAVASPDQQMPLHTAPGPPGLTCRYMNTLTCQTPTMIMTRCCCVRHTSTDCAGNSNSPRWPCSRRRSGPYLCTLLKGVERMMEVAACGLNGGAHRFPSIPSDGDPPSRRTPGCQAASRHLSTLTQAPEHVHKCARLASGRLHPSQATSCQSVCRQADDRHAAAGTALQAAARLAR
jgi:hypothetical protein